MREEEIAEVRAIGSLSIAEVLEAVPAAQRGGLGRRCDWIELRAALAGEAPPCVARLLEHDHLP